MLKFIQAESAEHLRCARELFEEYAASLNFNLCFQDFDKEIADLPGDYASPSGRLLLASDEMGTGGCVALRKLTEDTCEMKRLYARPAWRGKGIGKALAVTLIEEARRIGYARMRLDTLPQMKQAIVLYRSLGFKNIEPYRFNPVEGAMFMELSLSVSVQVVDFRHFR